MLTIEVAYPSIGLAHRPRGPGKVQAGPRTPALDCCLTNLPGLMAMLDLKVRTAECQALPAHSN